MGQRRGYSVSDETMAAIVQSGSTETLIDVAQKTAKAMVEGGLTTTQFRTVFGQLRQIHSSWTMEGQADPYVRKLQMLKPKLAYQVARTREQDRNAVAGMTVLRDVLTSAIDHTGADWKHFQNMMDFVEATLAYFIAEGGR